jgi:predicted nucleic acid-binding protein
MRKPLAYKAMARAATAFEMESAHGAIAVSFPPSGCVGVTGEAITHKFILNSKTAGTKELPSSSCLVYLARLDPLEYWGSEGETSMSETYILDTCVFNRLADDKIRLPDISTDGLFVATHVQLEELKATPMKYKDRREQLIAVFEEVGPHLLPAETFCFDISHFGDKWSNGRLFKSLKARLDEGKQKANNTQDALIAEVAIVQKLTLVTADTDLADTAREHGGKVLCID